MLYVPQLSSEVGFALFKPDLFHRQLLVLVFKFLQELGFIPLSFLAARVSDDQYKKMYSSQFLWEVDDWYHNKKIYTFGPGLGILLYHEKGNTQERLSQMKGAALPKDRQEGSLRRKFSSKSRVFNLIHVPDNKQQAEKEALQWFEGNPPSEKTSFEEIVTELECFNCFEAQLRLDPEEAFLIAKLRLFHICKNSRNCPEKLKIPLIKTTLFFHRWKNALRKETSCNGIEGTLLSSFEQEEEILYQQLSKTCEDDPIRKQMVKVISSASSTKYISNFFWILDEWNVYLSDLEKYLILSRLKYNPLSARDVPSCQNKI